jgi:hypothetical protein
MWQDFFLSFLSETVESSHDGCRTATEHGHYETYGEQGVHIV